MLLDGTDAHDQEDDAKNSEHDLEAEDLVEGCDAGSVDQRAVPGVNELPSSSLGIMNVVDEDIGDGVS